MPGKAIRARGVVQGVGFRPAIWHLARRYGLTGEVWNDGEGVMIHAFGSANSLAAFIEQIPRELPPLARLDALECADLAEAELIEADLTEFRIVASRQDGIDTPIAADAATCPDCLADISNPANRRYRYPFTNCTHCGPRLSIVRAVPYDRANTSMIDFPMCPDCLREYHDPADRRFHAQANCCPVCGPRLQLVDAVRWMRSAYPPYGNSTSLASIAESREPPEVGSRNTLTFDSSDVGRISASASTNADPIQQTATLIRQGRIVAIKGLGGFHLACDATNAAAVDTLRQRKRRYAKPFALMARDLTMLRRFTDVNATEIQALQDKTAPIVLLRAAGETLPTGIAPGDDKLGFMLPYTPLHTLLMQALDEPIVLTSGNISDEPQCIANDDALQKLAGIADFFLLHDRGIVQRLDDSVLRVMAGMPCLLRRARGHAPLSILLPPGFAKAPPLLAMGGELKNTFCLLKSGQAILSPHMGDLEHSRVQQDYRQQLALYRHLFDCQPRAIAVDLHDNYLSTQLGREWAEQQQLPLLGVQHHHAHVAACMAEHGLGADHPPLLGVAMDGLGLGDDGQLWGGEFLKVDYRQSSRLAAFDAIPLLGGAQAMRQPWRNSYAQLKRYFDWPKLTQDYAELEIIRYLNRQPLQVLDTMLAKRLNSPASSSCGRCFDAFSAALGLCRDGVAYEGQAAIALEMLAGPVFEQQRRHAYPYDKQTNGPLPRLSWQNLWRQLLNDLQHGVAHADIAARIHHGLARAIADTALALAGQIGSDTIALGGGVFQNRLLLEEVCRLLETSGKRVLAAALVPSNDGGLALGQAVVAAARVIDTL